MYKNFLMILQTGFNATYESKINGLPAIGSKEYHSHKDIYDKNYKDALKEIEGIYIRRGHELAQIANPKSGREIFSKVILYKGWGKLPTLKMGGNFFQGHFV